ncbi:DUF3993 domain-containing protein [Niallia taxi]|nr:DUF3993 domain-containing protein [Niallia taxi]MDE5051338.1 DUF3993 domain-containing protein [Niallia taxi]
MKKTMTSIFVLVLALAFAHPSLAKEKEELSTRGEVLQFLEDAFKAQVSLSERYREMEEVNAILTPYFSNEYKDSFLEANLVTENGKFLTYGSDFAPYYIPFFQFSEKTEIDIQQDKIYVYEYFEAPEDGPLYYEDHYEGLLLEKTNDKWKVSSQLTNEEIVDYLKEEKENDSKHQNGMLSLLNINWGKEIFADIQISLSTPFVKY